MKIKTQDKEFWIKKIENLNNKDKNIIKLNTLNQQKDLKEKIVIYHKDINLYLKKIETLLEENSIKQQIFKTIQTQAINDDENNYIYKMDFVLSCTGDYENIFEFLISFNEMNCYEVSDFTISSTDEKNTDQIILDINFSIYTIHNISNDKIDLDVKAIKNYKNPFYYNSGEENENENE